MPIVHSIDRNARVVVAVWQGVMIEADVFAYQREVWSRPDVLGFDELVDMTGVTEFVMPSTDTVRQLVDLAAQKDVPDIRSRVAIVAATNHAYGLARMYQTYRELDPRTNRDIEVFRTLAAARAYLQVDGPLSVPTFD
jgi:hypothetical protein